MKTYKISWAIDIETDDGPVDAARRAFRHMQRPGTWANCFTVEDEEGRKTFVDLEEEGK